jgi:O-antigen/teichoic acid export membrane protein
MRSEVSTARPLSLRQAAISGVIWLGAQSLGSRVLAFASQLLLAWFLAPADFGKIGLAYTISGIASAFVSFGIEDVLLHRRKYLGRWEATGFWISLALGIAGMIIALIAAHVSLDIYRDPSLVPIVEILAVSLPIGALSTIPSVRLRAEMNFRFLATYNIAENAAMQSMVVVLAALGAGPYSFAIPMPILACAKAVLFWSKLGLISNWRVKPVQVRYLLSRGSASAGERLLIELVAQCDYILLGLLTSQAVVGLYFFAFRLAAQPIRLLAGSFQNVLLAALAQLGSEPGRQAQAAFRTARILAFVVVPLSFMQAALARPFLLAFFGTKWEGSILLVQILSLGLPFDAVSWVIGAFLKARGEFQRAFLFSLVFAPIFVLVVAIGCTIASAEGAALAVSGCYIVMPIVFAAAVFRRAAIPVRKSIAIFVFPVLLAAPTVGAAVALSLLNLFTSNFLVQVVGIGALGSTFYVAATAVFFPDVTMELVNLLPVGRSLVMKLMPMRRNWSFPS